MTNSEYYDKYGIVYGEHKKQPKTWKVSVMKNTKSFR